MNYSQIMGKHRRAMYRWLNENGYSASDMPKDGESILEPRFYINIAKPKLSPKKCTTHWYVNGNIYGCESGLNNNAQRVYKNISSDIGLVSCKSCRRMLYRAFRENSREGAQ